MMVFDAHETIVAISSAAGAAARSIVRLSGLEAIALSSEVFHVCRRGTSGPRGPAEPLDGLPGFRFVDGTVRPRQPVLLEAPARAYLFRAPRSYTRQDVVELHVPGEVVASLVHAAMLSAGARQAEPGEFTARAFLSGRLDLAAAEAVADVVEAEADAQLRSAVGMLEGALGSLCRAAAEALTEVLAIAEASIDFAEEDLDIAPAGELAQKIASVADDLSAALAASGRWQPAAGEPKVAIAGRPNAGKSSLLNALSGLDRAIVSALAGTTRDVLSAPATLPGGVEVMLLDAAGLVVSDDPLTLAAHAAARDAVVAADAVLFVIDAAGADHHADLTLLKEVTERVRRAPILVLANKTDLLDDADPRLGVLSRLSGRKDILPVSVLTGAGLPGVGRALAGLLVGLSAPQPSRLLLHDRHRRGVAAASESASRAAELLSGAGRVADAAEILAVELRAALNHLRELTGEVVTEDILSAIFERFCVGK